MSERPRRLGRGGIGVDDERPDKDLVSAVSAGSQDALAEIYRRWGGAVHGTALAVLRDPGLAEDVTQAVFVAFWGNPARFDPSRGSLRALLVSMAHHRGIDVVRSSSARARREEKDARQQKLAVVPDPVAEEVCGDAAQDAVSSALASLDADQRAVIELAYLGGRTYREVARELGLPEGTVKSRIRRGLDRMRARLEDEGAL